MTSKPFVFSPNLVPRVFRLCGQRGNAGKTLGTTGDIILDRTNSAVSVVLRMPQFSKGSKSTGDSQLTELSVSENFNDEV